ncbi:hypothetical protein R4P64_32815 [Rhodococcus sp. IEGM 1366]|uniref:hypothetical protein n=1 Tax=Rhodococcus sp. IEGM 1366 TaxID=3082223 RepID=UPI0029535929|nr:hypothetical protein [Rhodococcus sp. IEGM 1366]MDV8071299.1 hypothetical protein [Rhodococcus sp. IEGM 1366]
MGPGRFRDRRHGDRDKQRQQVRSPPARGTDRAEAWARAVFAEFDEDWQRIYLLGGNDPDSGRLEHGLAVYRLFLQAVAS